MERGSKVNPTLKPNTSPNDESDDQDEEDAFNAFLHEMGIVYASLRGNANARAKFKYFMDTLYKHK